MQYNEEKEYSQGSTDDWEIVNDISAGFGEGISTPSGDDDLIFGNFAVVPEDDMEMEWFGNDKSETDGSFRADTKRKRPPGEQSQDPKKRKSTNG